MGGSGTAPGPGWGAGIAGADTAAAVARFPAGLAPGGSGDRGTPEQQLRRGDQAEPGLLRDVNPPGPLHLGRGRGGQDRTVLGDSPLAAEFRRLIAAGAVPGWDLHPVPAGHTPLHVLAGPLYRLSGSYRFYNLLERNGFASVEEVAAMPEACWFELRNCGTRFITAVRQVIAELRPGDLQARTGSLPGSGGAGPAAGGPVTRAALPAAAARALQVIATWAVAEHEAQTLGDLLTLASRVQDLPPDVSRNWDCICKLDLRTLAGAALPDGDLPQLASDLLGELEERRRLILTSHTFAPARRTYDSLAAELGVGRERVRQLETSALQQLARAAAHDRYRPLRWRAVSAARPRGSTHAAAIPGAPTWMGQMLSWLADKPA